MPRRLSRALSASVIICSSPHLSCKLLHIMMRSPCHFYDAVIHAHDRVGQSINHESSHGCFRPYRTCRISRTCLTTYN
ncbi:uncharacterized protein C8Q71DRAFT_550695 [Rhodofomes roseus]|uniref:Secreted protein n=1 Tax=Rhodofomes roseus TaxID=34475 RepID=A0ABQ8KI08_9APHY|nr:uncharacterized protein C8Q71DRAFT_550695 [Rhodofomes roseus]KAH9837589.1 hypothetical protein C8Q71DRAFT_550695 [Rhodofomes roseus]